jgi:hypothetical protein
MVERAIDTPAVVVSKRKSIEKYQFPRRTLALASKQPKRKLPKNQTMRPPTWNRIGSINRGSSYSSCQDNPKG